MCFPMHTYMYMVHGVWCMVYGIGYMFMYALYGCSVSGTMFSVACCPFYIAGDTSKGGVAVVNWGTTGQVGTPAD